MFKCTISFTSLNVRGLKDLVKRISLFLFCKGRKAHCLLLQETHSSDADVNFWTNMWGDRILFSHVSNRSVGVAICFHRFPGDVITHRTDKEGHWLIAVLKIESHLLILINIYGHKSIAQNRQMLEDITSEIDELKALIPLVILVGGDWNMVSDKWEDRWPSKFNNNHFNPLIESFNRDNSLVDIWRTHPPPKKKQYSWYKPNGTARSRIDNWLATDMLEEFVSEALISRAPLTDYY